MASRQQKDNDNSLQRVGKNRYDDFAASFERISQRMDQEYGAYESPPPRRRWSGVHLLSIAASLLVLLTVAFFLCRPGSDSELDRFRSPISAEPVSPVRGSAPANAPRRASALRAYEAADYARAAQLWASLADDAPAGTDQQSLTFYSGLAHYLAREPQPAVDRLRPLAEQPDSDPTYRAMAALYLGLAYLDLEREAAARTALNSVPPTSRRCYARAREVLSLLTAGE